MSHRWQRQQLGRRSPRRRQLPRPDGLCLGPHLQRHPGRRAGWLPSFLCVADKRVCRNVHERSSSPGFASLVSFNSMIWPLIGEGQLMAEPFAFANDGLPLGLTFLVELIDILDRPPVCNVARLAFPEEAVKHATTGQ